MFAAQCCPARVDALCRRRHQKASAVARTASLASTSPCLDVLEASLPWTAGFTQHFLRTYWQKKPCLLRGALPTNYAGLLNADELAGLACDEEAESRLIVERGGARPWELHRGPFQESNFLALPETHWTLVVNGVDRAVPQVAQELLPLFAFLPSWRVDDIQVSFAPAHGSVGPHSDQYDVFLLQAGGRKKWSISRDARYGPLVADAFVPGLDVAVLRDFVAEETHVLEAGDMLYLPPGVAHHGVALEAGFTYSIGFLAPTRRELHMSWAAAASGADPRAAERWTDPWLTPALRPGELSGDAVDAARAVLESLPRGRDEVALWLGSHVTAPRSNALEPAPLEEVPDWTWLVQQATEAGEVLRHEGSRFAYLPQRTLQPGAQGGWLFVDSLRFAVHGDSASAAAAAIADCRSLSWAQLTALGVPAGEPSCDAESECVQLLSSLVAAGFLFVPTDEPEEDEEDGADARDIMVDLPSDEVEEL